jgi:hypothetical protein
LAGISDRIDDVGDVLIEALLGVLAKADVIELGDQGGGDHLVSHKVDGVGGAQIPLDSTCFAVRIAEVVPVAAAVRVRALS